MSAAKTKSRAAKTDTKPRQNFSAIAQLGLRAQALADKNKAKIGLRLSALFLTGFADDLAALTAEVPAALTVAHGRVQLTAEQVKTLATGYQIVRGIRMTVKSGKPTKEVLLAFGVGVRTNAKVVKEVTTAIQKILARVAAAPNEAASMDIIPDDVAALTAALSAIQKANAVQSKGRAGAPQSTKARNATARRILAGVMKIAGAGMRAFPNDATAYASFERLTTKKKGL